MNELFLTQMRAALAGFMEADPYYASIPIITERKRDVESRIDEQVSKIGGIAIILITPTLGGPMPNIPGANFSKIVFLARHYELPARNSSGKEAIEVALHTAALWSQLKPDAFSQILHPDDPSIVLGDDPKYLSWDVIYITEGGTKIDIPQLDAPAIDASDTSAVELISTQPGAAIFYTLDNSAPSPRNPTATVYTAPFDASTSGTKIRSRTWLAGYIPSTETKLTTA
jgi:hypothetical protein